MDIYQIDISDDDIQTMICKAWEISDSPNIIEKNAGYFDVVQCTMVSYQLWHCTVLG